jgi:hypothetical protein
MTNVSNTFIMPSSEADRKKLLGYMQEISNALLQIESQREQINAILDTGLEELGIPKKVLRRASKVYHKQNLMELEDDFETIKEIYTTVVK